MDYSPWLNDDLEVLVEDAWENNFVYSDVTLKFKSHCKVSQLKLYDLNGVFDTSPAEFYALNGTKLTYMGNFSGPGWKTFQYLNFPTPFEADAIVVRKYSNNIPQKIFAYGTQDAAPPVVTPPVVTPPVVTPPVTPPVVTPPSTPLVKIPVEVNRWFQLNNSSNGLGGLFDGVTQVDVNTGWGKVFSNYDAYYPVNDGEKIDLRQIKFYNHTGGLGDNPLTVSVIDNTGKRTVVGVYKGGYYNKWLGPDPAKPENFAIKTPVANIKYIVLNCWYQFPTEMELYGYYIAAPVVKPDPDTEEPVYPLNNYLGVNAFEWDFEDGNTPDKVDATRLAAMKTFTQIRHYMDWQKLESTKGGFTYAPTHSGGWSYDAMYQTCKANNILVLADLKTLPDWLLESYPAADRDYENVPVKFGADFSDPKSYIDQARVAFQFTARYGANTKVDKKLLSVNSSQRWTGDGINTVKVGLNYIKYIECDNERDKWWKGRKGYQTAYEYAANMSAFYDGHKNTMGAGVGVKNADPTMQVVMGGLASATTEYVQAMVEWCKINRGYKADGSVNLCWDVVNYHWYSHDGQMIPNSVPTRGVAPDMPGTMEKAKEFIAMVEKYCKGMPVWVTELGYDANPGSPMRAIPIGKKTILQTQADWIIRSAFLYARSGVERIFFYQAYDDNFENPIQYGSSGLLNQNKTRKLAADYILQTKNMIGNYSYKETLSKDPIVDRYEYSGQNAYVMYVPDEKGRTAKYTLTSDADSAKLCSYVAGGAYMRSPVVKSVNGKFVVDVSETPVILIPYPKVAQKIAAKKTASITDEAFLNKPVTDSSDVKNGYTVDVYPNPSAKYVNVSFKNTDTKRVNITVSDATIGRNYGNYNFDKLGDSFSQTIDISRLPLGVCLVTIQQGDKTVVKRVIKTN